MNNTQVLTIIPAAGLPNSPVFPSYTNLPDCMIPINSKPVIGHILDDLLERGLTDVLLILRGTDEVTEKYVQLNFSNKISLNVVYVDGTKGMVGSLIGGIDSLDSDILERTHSVFIYSGDTIYKGDLDFQKSFLTVTSNYGESHKWCMIDEKEEGIYEFINKPLDYVGAAKALTGLYFFDNIKKFFSLLGEQSSGEFFRVIEKYGALYSYSLIESEGWYDIGNIDNYYQAKIDFLKVRHFNSLEYNPLYSTIKKTSSNNEKICAEVQWFLDMPDKLKVFTPRVVDYKIAPENSYYELEYYGYGSLGDMFLFGHINIDIWKSIIEKLFSIIKLFSEYKSSKPYEEFYDMYVQKTLKRCEDLKKDPFFSRILKHETISINGNEYRNISYFIPMLESWSELLYDENDVTFIHGDFFPGNILYDINNRIIKFFDPRGSFGTTGIYGDIKYDIAKMRHSLVGGYDFIVSDLFSLDYDADGREYKFDIYSEDIHKKIALYFDRAILDRGFSLNKIRIIESLLFLSMIPLHSDYPQRQKAMYLIALQKLNQFL